MYHPLTPCSDHVMQVAGLSCIITFIPGVAFGVLLW